MTMLQSPAAERNKGFILNALLKHLPETYEGHIVEIASGTGQHVNHYAKTLKYATFQPTEVDKSLLDSIKAYTNHFKLTNVKCPLVVDIVTHPNTWHPDAFPAGSVDVIINANMVHISPWKTSIGLFQAAQYLLKPQGYLFMYGPFAKDGVLEPESNRNFDASLKSRDPSWGIRDIADLSKLAEESHIKLVDSVDMPANNKTLVWQKTS